MQRCCGCCALVFGTRRENGIPTGDVIAAAALRNISGRLGAKPPVSGSWERWHLPAMRLETSTRSLRTSMPHHECVKHATQLQRFVRRAIMEK